MAITQSVFFVMTAFMAAEAACFIDHAVEGGISGISGKIG